MFGGGGQRIGVAYAEIVLNRDKFQRDVRGAEGTFRQGAGGITRSANSATQSLMRMVGVVGGLYALAGAIRSAWSAAVDFDVAWREVWTLTDASEDQMRALANEIGSVAASFGYLETEGLKAFYDITSAGFQGAEAMQIFEASAQGAIGGVADLSTSADLLTSILNAYRMEAGESEHVMDLLFTTIKEGKVTMDLLASGLGRVTGMSGQLGVELDEVLSAVATLTAAGAPLEEVFTGLVATMTAMLSPTTELEGAIQALGFESGRAMLEQHSLAGSLEMLMDYALEAGLSVEEMFTNVRALRTVLPLTGTAAEQFNETLDRMADSGGAAAEAYEKMRGAAHVLNVMQAEINRMYRAFGDVILPPIADFIENHVIPAIQNMTAWIQQNAVHIRELMRHFLGLLKTVGIVLLLVKAFALLTSPILWLMGAAVALYFAWDVNLWNIRDAVTNFVEFMKDTLGAVFDVAIKPVFELVGAEDIELGDTAKAVLAAALLALAAKAGKFMLTLAGFTKAGAILGFATTIGMLVAVSLGLKLFASDEDPEVEPGTAQKIADTLEAMIPRWVRETAMGVMAAMLGAKFLGPKFGKVAGIGIGIATVLGLHLFGSDEDPEEDPSLVEMLRRLPDYVERAIKSALPLYGAWMGWGKAGFPGAVIGFTIGLMISITLFPRGVEEEPGEGVAEELKDQIVKSVEDASMEEIEEAFRKEFLEIRQNVLQHYRGMFGPEEAWEKTREWMLAWAAGVVREVEDPKKREALLSALEEWFDPEELRSALEGHAVESVGMFADKAENELDHTTIVTTSLGIDASTAISAEAANFGSQVAEAFQSAVDGISISLPGFTGIAVESVGMFTDKAENELDHITPITKQAGGSVPGTGTGDIIPAMLEPGEFVIPKWMMRIPWLRTLVAGIWSRGPRMQEGGAVDDGFQSPGWLREAAQDKKALQRWEDLITAFGRPPQDIEYQLEATTREMAALQQEIESTIAALEGGTVSAEGALAQTEYQHEATTRETAALQQEIESTIAAFEGGTVSAEEALAQVEEAARACADGTMSCAEAMEQAQVSLNDLIRDLDMDDPLGAATFLQRLTAMGDELPITTIEAMSHSYQRLRSTLETVIEWLERTQGHAGVLPEILAQIELMLDPIAAFNRQLRELVQTDAGEAARRLREGLVEGARPADIAGSLSEGMRQAISEVGIARTVEGPLGPVTRTPAEDAIGMGGLPLRWMPDERIRELAAEAPGLDWSDWTDIIDDTANAAERCGSQMARAAEMSALGGVHAERWAHVLEGGTETIEQATTATLAQTKTAIDLGDAQSALQLSTMERADIARELISEMEREIDALEMFGMSTEEAQSRLLEFQAGLHGLTPELYRLKGALEDFAHDLGNTIQRGLRDLFRGFFSSLIGGAQDIAEVLGGLNVPIGGREERIRYAAARPGEPPVTPDEEDWLADWFERLFDGILGLFAGLLSDLAWENFIKPILWEDFVQPFLSNMWYDIIQPFLSDMWYNVVQPFLSTMWYEVIEPFSEWMWKDVIEPFLSWMWLDIIEPLTQSTWLQKITALLWPDYLPELDWARFINPIEWPALLLEGIQGATTFLQEKFDQFFGWLLGIASEKMGKIGAAVAPVISALGKALVAITGLVGGLTSLGVIVGTGVAIFAALEGAVRGLIDLMTAFLKPIIEAVGDAYKRLQPFIKAVQDLFGFLAPVMKALGEVVGIGIKIFTDLVVALAPTIQAIANVARLLAEFLAPAISTIATLIKIALQPLLVAIQIPVKALELAFKALERALTPIIQAFTFVGNVIRWFADAIMWAIDFINPLKKAGPFPRFSQLAEGGIVMKPTLAVVGEAGPEVFAPLSKLGDMGLSGDITIHSVITLDGKQVYESVKRHSAKENMRRSGYNLNPVGV